MQTVPNTNTTFSHSMLEGFTKTSIDTYLALASLSKRERTHLVTRIFTTLAQGTNCAIFSTQDFGFNCDREDYLIHGPGRYLVKGHGETVNAFHELDERLSFFLKPGFSPAASLSLREHLAATSQNEDAHYTMSLKRDEGYHYMLASERTFLIRTCEENVELAIQTQTIQLNAPTYWNFVFASEDVKAEISVAHAATLLGLSTLTLRRRIGEKKLPAVRASSSYPGIRRHGIEEYIAYRLMFPQGCISPGQFNRYQTWRALWRERYWQKGDTHERDA